MDESSLQTQHLDERLFKRISFALPWFVFLTVILQTVSWPIRNITLVCWVYGSKAYFHDGIRVLPGRLVKFSNGIEAPTLPDLVTGFGAFFITFLGLTMLLIFGLRFYEKYFRQRDSHAISNDETSAKH